MSDAAIKIDGEVLPEEVKKNTSSSTFSRVLRYSLLRMVMLFVTVVIGIYLTILVANMGGYVDEIRKGEIRSRVSMEVYMDPSAEMKQLLMLG